ncbi:MAG: hypothetical protein GXX96_16205 [Planctomycetaceae bacterium]|nr:hypothetical protein [Planctomycetaceae bacterium]
MTRLRDITDQLTHYWTTISLRTRIVLLVACLFVLSVGLRGCGQSSRGAQTVEELIERYERAHERKSIRQLRKILWLEAVRPFWAGRLNSVESLMLEVFEVPLAEVRYVAAPPPDPERGSEAIYYIPGPRRKLVSMHGWVHGKLLLVADAPEGQEPRIIDPGYIVLQPQGGGPCFIYNDRLVTRDALDAYQNNTEPKYVAAPLGTSSLEL